VINAVDSLKEVWFLEVNKAKSKVLVSRMEELRYTHIDRHPLIGGIQAVSKIKYLGHQIHNEKYKSTQKLLVQIERVSRRVVKLKHLGLDTTTRQLISDQLVKSVMMYLITPFFAARYLSAGDVKRIETEHTAKLENI
jgi:hypothetical protein